MSWEIHLKTGCKIYKVLVGDMSSFASLQLIVLCPWNARIYLNDRNFSSYVTFGKKSLIIRKSSLLFTKELLQYIYYTCTRTVHNSQYNTKAYCVNRWQIYDCNTFKASLWLCALYASSLTGWSSLRSCSTSDTQLSSLCKSCTNLS